jgi:hypothetical protein
MLDVEPKDFALILGGTDLIFEARDSTPAFTISSLPNFDVFAVEAHNAGTITQEAYFSFMVKTSDEVTHKIDEGFLCSLTDGFYIYTFILIDSPQPDMTGWSILKTNYLGKTYV